MENKEQIDKTENNKDNAIKYNEKVSKKSFLRVETQNIVFNI